MICAFRVDAGAEIGAGHVMRCMVLAAALKDHGASVTFICRRMPGDMIQFVRDHSFDAVELPDGEPRSRGCTVPSEDIWQQDAVETAAVLEHVQPHLLVVDHYQLDVRWERHIAPFTARLMAIDDLANRPHDCDIVLDQNLKCGGAHGYDSLVPQRCIQLLGPGYALVRSEFTTLRSQAIERRKGPGMQRLLVSMGGSDPTDETGRAIAAVRAAARRWKHIDVVVGASYVHTDRLRHALENLPAQLHVQTSDMARLMLDADFGITASGSTSWEKCVLGLPSLAVAVADNQFPIAKALHERGAHIMLDGLSPHACRYSESLESMTPSIAKSMSDNAFEVCDGLGASRVTRRILDQVSA